MDDRGQDYEGAAPPDPPASPQARRRVALVIGNSEYGPAVGILTNPANDARAVADRLQEPQFGFTVTLLFNLGRSAMLQAFNAFYAHASGAEDAVIYYAGHGVQVNGNNVLLPTDFKHDPSLVQELLRLELPALGVGLDRALAATARAGRTIIILDACRNDPTRELAAGGMTGEALRSLMDQGFGKVDLAGLQRNNTLVAFSADTGQKALDGIGDHSPYTEALVARMGDDKSFVDVLAEIRGLVHARTNNRQSPRYDSTLVSAFKLVMSASPNSKPTGPINVDDRTVEHTKWQFLKEHGTVLDLARFIEKENPIIYAGDARRLLQVRIEQSTDIARLQRLVDEYPAASFHYEVKGRLQDLGWTKPSLSRPTRILGSQTPMKGSRRFLAGLALTAAIVLAAIALDRTEVVSISSLWRPEHSKEVRPPLTDAQRQIEAQFKVLVATGGREQLERFALAHPEYAQRVADELARRERAVAAAKAKQDKVDADRREAAAKAAAQAAADRHREIIARIARETDRDALLKISGDEPIHRKAVEQRLGALGYIQVSTAQDPVWLKPGAGKTEWFKDCPTCPEMVVAPADRFTMGSPAGEPRREPYHKGSEDQFPVTIGRPFAVGRFAVTRGEFAAFVAATGHKTEGGCFAYTGTDWKLQADRNWRSPGFTQTDRHPVVCVNWNDAQAYVSWLASTTKKSYRLQSDSEREYVARAGTTTPFWWGQAISATQANYDANYVYDGGIKGEWRKATVPVESFAANPWGLYNVHGNVSDWTEDCWNTTNAGNPGDGQARTTGECSFRVVRGGAWLSNPRSLRSAYRYYDSSGFRYSSLGFRVARTLDATPSAAQR